MKGKEGETTSQAAKNMTIAWADGKLPSVECMFFASLRYVKPGQSIAEIILQQFPLLVADGISKDIINAALVQRGTMLILDGYNEYRKGTNTEIDDIIEMKILRRCTVVVHELSYISRAPKGR